MAKIDLGRVVGPPGKRGTRWFVGTQFVGESIVQAFLPSDDELADVDNRQAIVGDFYLNNITGDYYICVFPGEYNIAKWTYKGTFKGEKGSAFVYEDFTPEQLQSITGPKGDRGQAFKFDAFGHLTDRNDDVAIGNTFLDVDSGIVYIKVSDGWSYGFQFKGDKGTSIVSVTQSSSAEDEGNNIITFNFDNNTSQSVTIKNGSKGNAFVYEDFTPEQLQSITGPQGISVSSIQQISSSAESQIISFNLQNGQSAGQVTIMNGIQGIQGSIWHTGTSLQGTGEDIALDNNELYEGNYRLNDYYLNTSTANYYICILAGNKENARWSYKGTFKGPKGQDGVSIAADAKGLYNERNNYDNENSGFAYLAIDQGVLYIKLTNNSGDWSEPIYIRGEKGEKGENGFYFMPRIDENGILSWTNNSDGQINNPEPVNLRTAGTNVICSPNAPSKPYNGLIWIKSNNESELDISSLKIIKSNNKPSNVQNGTIWIKNNNQ